MAKRRKIGGGLKRQRALRKALDVYFWLHPHATLHGVASMIDVPSTTLYRWASGAGLPADGPSYRRAMAGLEALIAGDPMPKDNTPDRAESDARVRYWTQKIQNESELISRAQENACAPPNDTAPIGWIVGISLAIGAVIGGAVVALAGISGVLPL
jgi:hypothetical protein